MNKLAGFFMKAGLIYALFAFALGMLMAASKNFTLRPVHTHLNLIGWISMAIFAFYYQFVPSASVTGVAKAHFWLANVGVILMTVSVGFIVSGYEAAEAGAATGSILTLASLALFIFIVFKSA